MVSVDLDLGMLVSKHLSAQDVVNALASQNLILPSGSAKIGSTEYDIELNSRPSSSTRSTISLSKP